MKEERFSSGTPSKNKISNFGTIYPLYPNFIYHSLSLSQFEETKEQKRRKTFMSTDCSIHYNSQSGSNLLTIFCLSSSQTSWPGYDSLHLVVKHLRRFPLKGPRMFRLKYTNNKNEEFVECFQMSREFANGTGDHG